MTTVIRAGLFAAMVNAAITAQAVQFGWQELQGGGIEYIVQVEPELLDSFHQQGFTSDLPPNLRDVRSIRITVGRENLPNQNDLRGPATKAQGQNTAAPTSEIQPSTGNSAGSGTNSNQSTGDRIGNSPPAAKSAPATDQTLPPMPFLHSGLGRNTANNNGYSANPAEKVNDPQLKPDEGPRNATATDEANYQEVDANKPPVNSSESKNAGASDATTPKPWWALMAALLALFASLGANVYLVWIHQSVRAKYRALVQRSSLGGAAA